MKQETRILMIMTTTAVFLGLWQESVFAGFFFIFLNLLILTWADTLIEIWCEED